MFLIDYRGSNWLEVSGWCWWSSKGLGLVDWLTHWVKVWSWLCWYLTLRVHRTNYILAWYQGIGCWVWGRLCVRNWGWLWWSSRVWWFGRLDQVSWSNLSQWGCYGSRELILSCFVVREPMLMNCTHDRTYFPYYKNNSCWGGQSSMIIGWLHQRRELSYPMWRA